ncbi:MAG: DUF1269 domain-containing protein [Gammaproteobacteria bacterium]|nr:DUF1269 domain-containing protein [Gammaproteobacteria bacterium]
MKRLCFVSPDIEHARTAIAALRELGIADHHLHVVGHHDAAVDRLPDAGPESNDFLPAYERGLALGGIGGPASGLVVMSFPPAGIVVGGGALLLVTLFGAGLGGLLTGMAGAAFPSSRLEQFEQAIENGALVVMADVAARDVEAAEDAVRRIDPEVEITGVEPPAPIIP